jgi:hypothetical protein
MTEPTSPIPPNVDHGHVSKPRRWPARVAVAAGVIVALIVGVAIGATANSHQSQLNTANATIRADRTTIGQLKTQLGTLQTENVTLQGRVASETNTADHALAVATNKVNAADAAKQAQLNQEAATQKSQQKTLNTELGNVQANTISASGVYVVGRDIKVGTWHTNGDGGQTDNACYFATLNSTNTSDISDNNNFDGSETVSLQGVYAFEIDGPCSWSLVP